MGTRHLISTAADARSGALMIRSRVIREAPVEFDASSPAVAAKSSWSPCEWAQNWAHEFLDAANGSTKSTSEGVPSLPWAQGVAGSNPVAPTSFRSCRSPIRHSPARRPQLQSEIAAKTLDHRFIHARALPCRPIPACGES